jgi:hypothetical protein
LKLIEIIRWKRFFSLLQISPKLIRKLPSSFCLCHISQSLFMCTERWFLGFEKDPLHIHTFQCEHKKRHFQQKKKLFFCLDFFLLECNEQRISTLIKAWEEDEKLKSGCKKSAKKASLFSARILKIENVHQWRKHSGSSYYTHVKLSGLPDGIFAYLNYQFVYNLERLGMENGCTTYFTPIWYFSILVCCTYLEKSGNSGQIQYTVNRKLAHTYVCIFWSL